MWTKMMSGPRKKAPKTIAVIDPDSCFGAFACSICQAACPADYDAINMMPWEEVLKTLTSEKVEVTS